MGQIEVRRDLGGIAGLCLIKPAVHGDSRGYFTETYSQRDMEEAGFSYVFVQDNQSSSPRGVLRGLHFQMQHPQAKLVRAIRGTVFDAVVDLRAGSPTFGKWHGEILSDENKCQLLVPRGFAHGYFVLSDRAEFCYKCDDYYTPGDEGGLAWNDPAVGIVWPRVCGVYRGSASAEGYAMEDGTPISLNARDQSWPDLAHVFRF